MELVVSIGVVAAIAAAFAQYLAHQIAERRRWGRRTRYAAGLTIINIAVAFPIFSAPIPIEWAVTLYGMLWLIGGLSGLATWAAYEHDRRPPGTPDADTLLRQLDDELEH